MTIVHCRYSHDHPDTPDLGDGCVWLCYGAIGPEDAPVDDLGRYHNALPLRSCSCGFDPRPYKPQPYRDGYWHPAAHP